MKKEVAAVINRPYPMYMENGRFFLKKKGWGNRLIYEVHEKKEKEQEFLGTCRIYWQYESENMSENKIPIAKVLVERNKKLHNVLKIINELLKEKIV